MVTIRSYANPVEAALAKSLLDDNNIFCRLADEDMNRYGGAPLAIPIRLMVAEDQALEAMRILDTPATESVKAGDTNTENVKSELPQDGENELIPDLRNLQHTANWVLALCAATLLLVVYLVIELPRHSSPWAPVSGALRQYDYERALTLAKRIAKDHPTDSYAHEYLGFIYFKMGKLHLAESEYSRAYQLSPPQGAKQKLDEIRQRLDRESKVQPSATPLPWPNDAGSNQF